MKKPLPVYGGFEIFIKLKPPFSFSKIEIQSANKSHTSLGSS